MNISIKKLFLSISVAQEEIFRSESLVHRISSMYKNSRTLANSKQGRPGFRSGSSRLARFSIWLGHKRINYMTRSHTFGL